MDNSAYTNSNNFFSDENFIIREQIKHDIRIMKEYLHECEIIYGEAKITNENITVKQLKEKLEEKIKPYKNFGADNW